MRTILPPRLLPLAMRLAAPWRIGRWAPAPESRLSPLALRATIVVLLFGPAAASRADGPGVATPPRAAVAESLSPSMIAEARRTLAEFPSSRYSHKTRVDRERGICNVDCSGLVVFLMKKVAPDQLDAIETEHKRPLAEDFYEAIASSRLRTARGWKRIVHMQNAMPGDVLTWIKVDREPGDNTGHVMLIDAKPVAESPYQFRVRVIDSTASGHADDARFDGRSGIGRGTLWIDVDDQGRPFGYRWKARNGRLHRAPIAIGRLVRVLANNAFP